MNTKRILWFTFHATSRELRDIDHPGASAFDFELHKTRDGAAFAEMMATLHNIGCQYGGVLFNIPEMRGPAPDPCMLRLGPDDLIVMTTRPPLDDAEGFEQKPNQRGIRRIDRSYTDLEEKLFSGLRLFFETSNRQIIRLSDRIRKQLPAGVEWVRSMQFRGTAGAYYRGFREDETQARPIRAEDERTCGFFVFSPEAWPDGPSVLASFAMGGVESLIFNYLLRRRMAPSFEQYVGELLASGQAGFLIAEFAVAPCPARPLDLSFADKSPFEVIVKMRGV